jgi:uncharacterized protein
MHINGTYTFKAPADRVWDVLMDTKAIAGCLPGCRELQPIGEDRYKADLVIAVAAITGDYSAEVSIEDQTPPHSYRLVVRGSGRPGFVNGTARVTLEPTDGGTAVNVDADADVGGAVARIGQRLIEGVARTTMNRFFACLSARLDA